MVVQSAQSAAVQSMVLKDVLAFCAILQAKISEPNSRHENDIELKVEIRVLDTIFQRRNISLFRSTIHAVGYNDGIVMGVKARKALISALICPTKGITEIVCSLFS